LDRRLDRRAPTRSARRRPPSNPGSRPDRVAAWAFFLGIFLILLAAATSNGATGGAAAPTRDTKSATSELGERVLVKGAAGTDVEMLERILTTKGYGDLAVDGTFDEATERAVQSLQRAAGLAPDGVVGPQTRPALVALMRVLKATWYGPGLYGKQTACGMRLRRTTLGVAHRTLPCGKRVTFYHAGRFLTVPVIDRGPFRRGVEWDLTAAAAKRLGFLATGRLRSLP
jgi:rare lipoprotein A (peptidoglycan hydrolase)